MSVRLYRPDPTREIVIIVRGRDATRAARTTIFGKGRTTLVRVTAARVSPPDAARTIG